MQTCKVYYVWRRPPVPPTSGHLACTDTFAWSRGCPFMTGTTVVENPPKKIAIVGIDRSTPKQITLTEKRAMCEVQRDAV